MQNEAIQHIMPPVGIIGCEVDQSIDESREQASEQRGEDDRSGWTHEQKDGKVKGYNIGNGKICEFQDFHCEPVQPFKKVYVFYCSTLVTCGPDPYYGIRRGYQKGHFYEYSTTACCPWSDQCDGR